MKSVDLLSDTTYRREAVEQLERLLGNGNTRFPVKAAQIYGLRQIARQQPDKVQEFARKQRTRAEKKRETAAAKTQPKLEAEIAFWTLVEHLSSGPHGWSLLTEGHTHLPEELRNENEQTLSRRERRDFNARRKKWLENWMHEHIPAFFERFCTHALYRIGMAANSEED